MYNRTHCECRQYQSALNSRYCLCRYCRNRSDEEVTSSDRPDGGSAKSVAGDAPCVAGSKLTRRVLAVVVVVLPTEADIDAVAATAADAGGTAAADALALAVPPVIFTIGGRAAEAACAELAAEVEAASRYTCVLRV